MKKIYRTVIQFEILSDEPFEDGTSLETITDECRDGAWSGQFKDNIVLNEELTGNKAIEALENQGTDPEFF